MEAEGAVTERSQSLAGDAIAVAVRRGEGISLYRRFGKRIFDIVVATLLLTLFAPILFLLAIVVVATSGWPPLYSARRLGRHGHEFSMFKLRTMHRNADKTVPIWLQENSPYGAEYARNFKVKDDPRITLVGRLLRTTSLDELPQLWNVIRGDMSLVGPRPIVLEELVNYGSHGAELLSARPGITGIWQITGRNEIEYPDRVWVELESVRRSGLTHDFSVLIRTLSAPFRLNGL